MDHQRRYIRTEAAAAYIGSTPSTLTKWRVYGTGPLWIKVGKNVLYDIMDLDQFMTSGKRLSTSQATA